MNRLQGFVGFVLSCWVSALLLSGCTGPDSPTGMQTGTVKGTVTIAGSGLPLSGVEVSCGGVTAITGATGTYELQGVQAGTRTLAASRSGYASYAGTVTITGGASSTRNLTLTASGPTTRLYGYVTNGRGSVANVSVTLDGTTTAIADGNGYYEFPAVPRGAHTIAVLKSRAYFYHQVTLNLTGLSYWYDVRLLAKVPLQLDPNYSWGAEPQEIADIMRVQWWDIQTNPVARTITIPISYISMHYDPALVWPEVTTAIDVTFKFTFRESFGQTSVETHTASLGLPSPGVVTFVVDTPRAPGRGVDVQCTNVRFYNIDSVSRDYSTVNLNPVGIIGFAWQ